MYIRDSISSVFLQQITKIDNMEFLAKQSHHCLLGGGYDLSHMGTRVTNLQILRLEGGKVECEVNGKSLLTLNELFVSFGTPLSCEGKVCVSCGLIIWLRTLLAITMVVISYVGCFMCWLLCCVCIYTTTTR